MITIVKPIPYLHTTAKNETTYTKITLKFYNQHEKKRTTSLPGATNIIPSQPL